MWCLKYLIKPAEHTHGATPVSIVYRQHATSAAPLVETLNAESFSHWTHHAAQTPLSVSSRSWYWCLMCGSASRRENRLFPVLLWEIETARRDQRPEGEFNPAFNSSLTHLWSLTAHTPACCHIVFLFPCRVCWHTSSSCRPKNTTCSCKGNVMTEEAGRHQR